MAVHQVRLSMSTSSLAARLFGRRRGNKKFPEISGHPDAEKCYAWSHRENGTSGAVLNSENMRLITVLGKRPVDSPEMAVRTAIFYDVQPVTPGGPFS